MNEGTKEDDINVEPSSGGSDELLTTLACPPPSPSYSSPSGSLPSIPPATQPGAVAVSPNAETRRAENDTIDEDTNNKKDRASKRRELRMHMRSTNEESEGAGAEKEADIPGVTVGEGEREFSVESTKPATIANIPRPRFPLNGSESATNESDFTPVENEGCQTENEGLAATVPMIQAELVTPPIEAYRVSIDEDPVNMTSGPLLSHLEIEQTQRKEDHDNLRWFGIVGKYRWILGVALGIIIICAVAVPLVVVSRDQSDILSGAVPSTAPMYPYSCYTSTWDILQVQMSEATIPEVFVICPNTLIGVGTFRDPAKNDFHFINGDYPITAVRENVVIQCGPDGKRENNCVFDGGFIQVLTLQVVPLPDGNFTFNNSIDNFTLRGLTFTGKPDNTGPFSGNSVTLSHPGKNIRFEDCWWSNFSAQSGLVEVGQNYYQEIFGLPLEKNTVEVTFSGCLFGNIIFDFPLISAFHQNVTIEKSVFRNIKLSALVDPNCQANSAGLTVDYNTGCAILLYCGPGASCDLNNVCLIDFEYRGPSIVHTTDGSKFEYGNLFQDVSEPDDCQWTVVALQDAVISNCTDIFTQSHCPITET